MSVSLVAMLDRAAGSKVPSRRVLSDFRIKQGGDSLRPLIGTPIANL